MFAGLKKQQSVFTHSRDVGDEGVKSSYFIASKVKLASKSFSEGEFVKTCTLKAADGRTVNFIRARGLNHCQFVSLLSDNDITCGLPYKMEVRLVSRGAALKCFFDL